MVEENGSCYNQILYIDNLKGFSDDFIPFKDVNFFVGENSTGKSSVLSILNIFHSVDFWMEGTFKENNSQFGPFKEIVNQNSDENYFYTGILNCDSSDIDEKSNDNDTKFDAVLFKYINDNGFPSVSEFCFSAGSHIILAKLQKNRESILLKVIDNIETSNSLDYFKDFVSTSKEEIKNGKFKKLSVGVKFPLLVLQSFINSNLKNIFPKLEFKNNTYSSYHYLMDYFNWIGPIRAEPKRIYDQFNDMGYSPEGEHTPFILDKMVRSKSNKSIDRLNLLCEFGSNSGLFDKLQTRKLGKDVTAPFEIDIKLKENNYKISNVGYGVSQVLPIAVDILVKEEDSRFAIQQPEVHLHPRAQAALGEFIFLMNSNDRKKFYIETHSEYLINRYRLNFKKNKKISSNCKAQVLFFERDACGNNVHIIDIDSEGNYSEEQPSSFTDFFIQEELDLLGL